jgi:hypothetical protein
VKNDSEKQKERYENTGELLKLKRFSSIFHVYFSSSTENKLATPSSGKVSRRTNLLTWVGGGGGEVGRGGIRTKEICILRVAISYVQLQLPQKCVKYRKG